MGQRYRVEDTDHPFFLASLASLADVVGTLQTLILASYSSTLNLVFRRQVLERLT